MTSLYQITLDIKRHIDEVLEQEWLPEATIDTLLPAIKTEALQKQSNVAAYILNLESDIEQMNEYIEKMGARVKSAKNHAEKLRGLLLMSMNALDQETVDCNEFTIKIKKNPAKVIINNEELVPDEYCRTKVIREPDKTKIGNELKRQAECTEESPSVPGCHLERGIRLEIK